MLLKQQTVTSPRFQRRFHRVGEYPLQHLFLQVGLLLGLIAGLATRSPLAGFATLVVFAVAGALWRPGEPALAYCLSFQWLFISTGYFYMCLTGVYPETGIHGMIETAVFLSLVGLLATAAGMRCGVRVVATTLPEVRWKSAGWRAPYSVERLFWFTATAGAVSWIIEISPAEIWFTGAQIIHRLLQFRHIFFFLLMLTIIRQRHGYAFGAIAFIIYLVPALSSHMSAFAAPFVVLFLAAVSEWRPWSSHRWERWRSVGAFRYAAGAGLVLVLLGLVWTGGVKQVWRPKVLSGAVGGSPVNKALAFTSTVVQTAPQIQLNTASRNLSKRMSSAVGYFSRTLTRVPALVPHANGDLTLRAVNHVIRPRLLFPDKENLGSDSWLVRRYAGLSVAGFESNTSIGLGYTAEFFIDYGVPGMFVALFVLGTCIGVFYRSAILFSPSYDLYRAVVFGLAGHFSTYGAELAKMSGGFLQTFIIFAVLLFLFGKPIHSLLSPPEFRGRPRQKRTFRRPGATPPVENPVADQSARERDEFSPTGPPADFATSDAGSPEDRQ